MATLHTVDASVFLSGFNPAEDAHETSRRFLARCQADAVPIIVPALLMPEVAGPIRRGRGDASLAMRFVEALRALDSVSPQDHTTR